MTTDVELAPMRDPLVGVPGRGLASRFAHSPVAMTAVLGLIYLAVSVFVFGGLHIDRPSTMVFCAALAFALSAHQPSRRALQLIMDWLPIALVLTAYDYARGAGHDLGVGTSYEMAPRMDHWLTGTIPTVWLQRHLYATSVHHEWDVLPTLTYFSYYMVTFLILAVLWARSRPRFRVYSRRFLAVTLLGLVVFVLHPTAPPWMDSHYHVIPHITRTTAYGLDVIHLPVAMHAFYAGAATFNEVAAFPSLHAVYSTLPLMMFFRGARPSVRVVLVLYPLLMDVSLVLTGEHWLTDIIGAWILTAAVAFGMPVLERGLLRVRGAGRRRAQWRAGHRGMSESFKPAPRPAR